MRAFLQSDSLYSRGTILDFHIWYYQLLSFFVVVMITMYYNVMSDILTVCQTLDLLDVWCGIQPLLGTFLQNQYLDIGDKMCCSTFAIIIIGPNRLCRTLVPAKPVRYVTRTIEI